MMWETRFLRTLANEDHDTLAENDPLTSFNASDILLPHFSLAVVDRASVVTAQGHRYDFMLFRSSADISSV